MSKEKITIPEISDSVLRELAEEMKPLRRKEGELFYVEAHNLRDTAFTWVDCADKAEGLEEVGRIPTLHVWGHYSLFKPSVGEVLAQLPVEYLGKGIVAFETRGPETAREFTRTAETKAAFDAGFHTAETILYRKAP
jgi:hypothetical protein